MHKRKKVFMAPTGIKIGVYHGNGDVDKVAYDIIVNSDSITGEMKIHYDADHVKADLAKEVSDKLLQVHMLYSTCDSDTYFEKCVGVLLDIFPEGGVITEALYFDSEEEEFYPLGCKFTDKESYRKVS